MLNIQTIQKTIELSLVNQNDNQIIIADKKYNEVICYVYRLKSEDVKYLVDLDQNGANNLLDVLERNDILNYFYSYDFASDMNTRQATFQPKYKEDNKKSACIASIQMLLRNGKVHINVNMRSSNYSKNWLYDQQTFALVMQKACDKFNLSHGYIHVTIGSLHEQVSE